VSKLPIPEPGRGVRPGGSPASPDRLELSHDFSAPSSQRLKLITREADPALLPASHVD
jgi:hypothetical protein